MRSLRFSRPTIGSAAMAATAILFTSALTLPTYAAAFDESTSTPELISQLEQRATQAKPREQCFLYTELVHAMTEQAGRQIAAGDTEAAAATLKQVNRYAHLIEVSLSNDTRRLKNAEELMHHTTYRLAEYIHLVSDEDRESAQATLKQLDRVNDQMLSQVFNH